MKQLFFPCQFLSSTHSLFLPMNLFQHFLRWVSVTKMTKPVCTSCHLNRNLTGGTCIQPQVNVQSSAHRMVQNSNLDPLEVVANQLQKCPNLQLLNQIHAKIIRIHLLELNPHPFHWNNIMRCYVRLEIHYMALRVFIAMSRAGICPDSYTIPIALKAACNAFAVDTGRQLHSVAIVHGLELNEFCESGLISLYCKAGDLMHAQRVFEQNPERKLGSWNAIIGGLAQGGHAREAIDKFMELMNCGVRPDDVTMVSVTSACGSIGDLYLALQLHKCVLQAKTIGKPEILMLNSLIDVYGKCGRMDLAYKVFAGMAQRNVSTWTSMIMGYAMHGHAYDALECFNYMREAGVIPNHVTFVGVLSACVHGGMVENGRHYFDMMRTFGLMPMLQHYGCMVDLLGRAGFLEEARKMVEEMPIRANSVIWGALMGACEKHRNVEMAEWVARHLVELEPWNDGVYVVLSNIYASAGMWEDVRRVRGVMKKRKVAKIPGYSLANNLIQHGFTEGI